MKILQKKYTLMLVSYLTHTYTVRCCVALVKLLISGPTKTKYSFLGLNHPLLAPLAMKPSDLFVIK